jgi:C4-dicarboxylate transporter, DctM subunit
MTAPAPAAETSRLTRFVGACVAVLGLVMVVLPTVQTVTRRLFESDIPGATVIVQHLTLWVGFVGAILAAATGTHLHLSTAEVVPAGWPRRLGAFITRAVTTVACALLAVASAKVVQTDASSGRTFAFDIPVVYSEAIMPFTFAVMALLVAFGPSFVGQNKLAATWADRGVGLLALVAVWALGFAPPSPWVLWPLGLTLLVGFFLGSPIFVGMAGVAMLLFFKDEVPIAAVPTETLRLVASPTLPAIPLLTMAGYVLAEGGAAERLVRAYKGFFGWLPGGVAIMATVVCAIFTTFTGGSGVTILAVGGLFVPMLIKEKYPEGFAHGLVTGAGSLGLLFPPSLPVILYSVVAQVPMEHLYLGGLVPGLLMMGLVAGWGMVVGTRHHVPKEPFIVKNALSGLWGARWDLGLPTVVVGTVATGLGTTVEAAALGCAYALLVEVGIFRTMHPLKDVPRVLARAATLVGAVVMVLGVAMGLSSWLVDAEIPTLLLEWTQEHVKSPTVFLLALNVGLLVLGSVLEIYAAIVVLAPLVAPIGAAYGIDPVHLGVVFLANLELGFVFPPMGLNLFLSSTRFQKKLPYLYRHTLPFLAILAVGVLLITYLDFMTTGIVKLVK